MMYKWIALYCNYTIHSAHNQTIYSVFVHRHSVCTGIAKAAQYLLKLLGFESRLVFGKMNNSAEDSRHCWLVVCLLSDVGTTAEIYLAHDKDKHNRHRAVAKEFKDDPDHELLRKELIVMRECAGPHLLRATDADFNKGILYIEQATPLSELLSIHYYKLTLKGLCNLLTDIASSLKELLNHGIIYRDIHLNNIYLWTDPLFGKTTYKLGDFGSCTFTEKSGKYAGLTERGGVGSKWYMALETWNEGMMNVLLFMV